MTLVEMVPNVSEGRDEACIDALAQALREAPSVLLLDLHRDPSHHRAVLTAAAPPEACPGAALALVERAVELVDLTRHEGVHPRIGAVDVLPFVPLGAVPMETVVALARDVARRIAARFALPVFLYGEAALVPSHRELADLRRGGSEGLAERLARGELAPDFGPAAPHETAGATAVGARPFLIAYNVNLETRELGIARAIARRVRASGGGLRNVKAMGVELGHRSLCQVSMNLTDFRVTSLVAAFDAVARRAAEAGVAVASSEIVGLVPEAAAFEGMESRLRLESPPGILEKRIAEAIGAT